MPGLTAMMLAAAIAQAEEPSALPAVSVFAESCAVALGDRSRLERIATARGWAPTAWPETYDVERLAWADAYTTGSTTILLAAYPARHIEHGVVSATYPAGGLCHVEGDLQEDWREPMRVVAEEQMGMVRSRPLVLRDPEADFQTALWRGEDAYVEAQYRRQDNSMVVKWVATGASFPDQ